jgi:alpha-galactosidase
MIYHIQQFMQYWKEQLAGVLEIPPGELDYICAGINHQTWFTRLSYRGEDMPDKVLPAFDKHQVYSRTEKVRIDVLKRFGYYSTESNGHLSEYLPWYRKRPRSLQSRMHVFLLRVLTSSMSGEKASIRFPFSSRL